MNTARPWTTGTPEPNPAPSPVPASARGPETSAAPAAKEPELPLRLTIGLLGMLLSSLLAILNEQVTALALADIRGAFSIGFDDGTWITALFEATNTATMMFAPWFGITFTLKRFTIGAVIGVMVLGFLCPLAPNLQTLYVLRILQGAVGGCLLPMLIIVALRYLPPKVKLYGLAGYALTATFGPALGTPLAALWTEYVGWQMTFWQIVPMGLLSCLAIYYGLPADSPKLERFQSFNWRGILLGYPAIGMIVIGFLQGDRLDWLNSPFICTMFGGGALLFAAFAVNEWFQPVPFFQPRMLSRRNFTHGLITLVGAVVLLVGVSAIPGQFLAHIHEYRPLQTTPLSLLVALPLLIALPATAALLNLPKVDHRWVIAIALLLMATTCYLGSFITSDWVRENFYWFQALQIIAQPMLILGILMGVTTGLAPTDGPFASAMFNTFKTLAGSLATGLIEGVGTARERFHSNVLVDHLGNNALETGESIDPAHGIGELAHRIHEQVEVLTSSDLYLMMACIALAFLVLIPVLPVRIYPPWYTMPPSSR